jgi:predicted O-methyltransferase YrrM
MHLNFLKYMPGYRRLSRFISRLYYQYRPNPFLWFASPGHFYSPLPDIQLVDRNKATLFDRHMNSIPGIENYVEDQLALVEKFSDYYDQLPFKSEKPSGQRFYFQNPFFGYGDTIILYSMIRHFQPKRIIEVGSGFSSAVMLDTNDLFFSKKIAFTFIEPFPERLFSLFSKEDKKQHEIVIESLQNVPLERFSALDARDILFIDSSHVAKIGSDVVHILTNILPRLNNGVIIHFHDIFWPFEYPEEWIREGRAWNESYILKAFLQFNSNFKILFFSSYLALHHERVLEQHLPLFLKMPGASLWIEKTS